MNALRFFHTVRHLRLRQIFGRVSHRLRRPTIDLSPAPPLRPRSGPWIPPVPRPSAVVDRQNLRFLNRAYPLATAADWNAPETPKLWLYNLHYFDFLQAPESGALRTRHDELIRRWIAENPPPAGNGWEPYPLSLRVVNWIKKVLAGEELPPEAIQSLAVQSRYLRRRLEYHLLGNHLLANGKALVFAGLFFSGRGAEEWLQRGLKILEAETREQFLSDGGHFERSPMYQAILLEDLLDLTNLLRAYGREIPAGWTDLCTRMGDWLDAMTHPDGEIVLFNDAAFGIAPTPAELGAYASRLGLTRRKTLRRRLIRLSQSGYLRCQTGKAVLFIDAAPVGPDYLPGHAHADTLTFELSLFGRRVVVDSGTSTYDKTAERQRQRGTKAHNTVTIDGEDSSEVWGGFRVARRARPCGLEVEEDAGQVRVACSHDGYRRLRGRPVHRREWRLGDSELQVRDTIEGAFSEAVARFHFHPDVALAMTGPGSGEGRLSGGRRVSFVVQGGNARLLESTYHPEFNVNYPNLCIEIPFADHTVSVVFSWD